MISKALVIREPWIGHILAGRKSWEMRGKKIKIRGRIGLVRKGSGMVVGTANLVGVEGPFDRTQMLATIDKHRISAEKIENGEVDRWPFAWKLADVRRLPSPVPYVHRRGAVTWVTLDSAASLSIVRQLVPDISAVPDC